ncbi:ROK family transcriptional regulator [Curtobacterium citreum]|uniref:ROK family transcriptional regulator n=1 Tax=Curtobacterium citreum TaxID=2036 RepID=UPI0009FA53C8|nr:ROK family transcriptional regulator [Curtobacterium citreum]
MHEQHFQDMARSPGSVGDVLRLIRVSDTTSRSSIARSTGLAPSTASARVDALTSLGLVRESGAEGSRGGRRARRLELVADAGFVAAADLGAHHVRIVLTDLAGTVLADTDALEHGAGTVPVAAGPRASVAALWQRFVELARDSGLDMDRFRGAAISIPAPVSYPGGSIATPSFEPSWHGAVLPELFAEYTDVPVLVENDANLIALAEHPEPDRSGTLVAVKLGTRIGAGVLLDGRLHRGVSGAAGEISHTPVDGEAAIGCTCGVPDCLESVASGGAVVARLRATGREVGTTGDVLALAAQGDPVVLDELRRAGEHIGRVLSGIVNFCNPSEVVLAGAMSASSVLVATIRGELYRSCLPMVADALDVRASREPRDAGIRGATVLAVDEVLAPTRIDEMVRTAAERTA